MLRRTLLVAAASPLMRAAAAPAGAPLLLFDGAGRAWGCTAEGPLQALPVAASPVPLADGAWAGTADARVQRWVVRAGRWSVAAETSLAQPLHALGAPPDGSFALAAHGEQATLLDAQARVLRRYEGEDLAHRARGPAAALYALPHRRSLGAAWPALGELWEISLDPDAAPIFDGLVHDYRMGEAIARAGFLGVRRAPLGRPLPTIDFVDPRVPWVAGRLDDGVAIVHLDVRRRVALLALPGARPQAACLRESAGGPQWWLPATDAVYRVDARRWTVDERLPLPAPAPSLQALRDTVWAHAGERLLRWRDGTWEDADGLPPRVTALGRDATAQHLLVVTDTPAQLWALDAEGRVQYHHALPPGLRITAVKAV